MGQRRLSVLGARDMEQRIWKERWNRKRWPSLPHPCRILDDKLPFPKNKMRYFNRLNATAWQSHPGPHAIRVVPEFQSNYQSRWTSRWFPCSLSFTGGRAQSLGWNGRMNYPPAKDGWVSNSIGCPTFTSGLTPRQLAISAVPAVAMFKRFCPCLRMTFAAFKSLS